MADKNPKGAPGAQVVKAVEEKPKNPKKVARQAAKTKARTLITEYLTQFDVTKPDEKALIDAIRLFIGGGQRMVTRSINAALRDAFIAAGDKGLTELEVFKQFKIGRPEMGTKIRVLLKHLNPEDRIWIRFDEEHETYRAVGRGKTPPKGWTGFNPDAEPAL